MMENQEEREDEKPLTFEEAKKRKVPEVVTVPAVMEILEGRADDASREKEEDNVSA